MLRADDTSTPHAHTYTHTWAAHTRLHAENGWRKSLGLGSGSYVSRRNRTSSSWHSPSATPSQSETRLPRATVTPPRHTQGLAPPPTGLTRTLQQHHSLGRNPVHHPHIEAPATTSFAGEKSSTSPTHRSTCNSPLVSYFTTALQNQSKGYETFPTVCQVKMHTHTHSGASSSPNATLIWSRRQLFHQRFLVPNYFCFYLIFLKKLGTKKPLVKKLPSRPD